MHIYTITVLSTDKAYRDHYWGYYFKEEDARKVIEGNLTDISECDYYHYAVLSKRGEGPLAIPEPIQWYEFIWDNGKFVRANKISVPEQFKSGYLNADLSSIS